MPTVIQREDVQRLVEAGAQLVEVLPRDEYEKEHLPGAVSLPLESFSRESVARALRPDVPAVVYCQDVQ